MTGRATAGEVLTATREVLAIRSQGWPTWSVAAKVAEKLSLPYTGRYETDRVDAQVRRALVKLAAAGEVRKEKAGRYTFWLAVDQEARS